MLKVDGDQITYELSLLEIIGAFGNSPKARIANLKSVTKRDNPYNPQNQATLTELGLPNS